MVYYSTYSVTRLLLAVWYYQPISTQVDNKPRRFQNLPSAILRYLIVKESLAAPSSSVTAALRLGSGGHVQIILALSLTDSIGIGIGNLGRQVSK